jgi:hypothetical protein
MALSAGTRLGPYEILALLGEGAMGEVYRARDPRLGRDIALKVLPPGISLDDDLVRRFEQEARAASALDHPNIVTVHDVGREDQTAFLAMELVEGRTLRTLLEEGRLPLRKGLSLASQIADGMAAAHQRGLVHRDLKPENIMVSREGRVKILDFGLAKLAGPAFADPAGSTLKLPAHRTVPGTLLGTVGYMSPEQAAGAEADFRSDQFSFGAIFYEIVSGRRAFERRTPVETLSAILREEPPPLALGGRVDLPVRRVIERCLSKDPDSRYGSSRDLARDVSELQVPISHAGGEILAERSSNRVPAWGRTAIAALALAGTAVLAALLGGRLARIPVPTFRQITFRRGTIWSARFGPDGETIVYGAAWDGAPFRLFTTRLPATNWRPLDPPSANLLSISRNGELAVSLDCRPILAGVTIGTLARLPLDGGVPRELAEGALFADWSPEGEDLAVVRPAGGKSRLEFPLGKTIYESGGWLSHPRISPAGGAIAFLEHPTIPDDRGSVRLVDPKGAVQTLSAGWASELGLAWAPRSDEVWFTATGDVGSRALYAVSPARRQRLIARVPGDLTLQDVSRQGRVLLTRDSLRIGIIEASVSPPRDRDLSWLDRSLVTDISADGSALLFAEYGEGGGPRYSAYLRPSDGALPKMLGEGLATALSPDGRWVSSIVPSSPPMLVLLPAAAGEHRRVDVGPIREITWAEWSPDGRTMVIAGAEPGRGTRLYVKSLGAGPPRSISPEGIVVRYGGGIPVSPDGKLVAAAREPDNAVELYRTDGAAPPRPVAGLTADDVPLRWSADGRFLFTCPYARVPLRIFRVETATGRKELWDELTPPDPAGVIGIPSVKITADGRNVAFSYARFLSELYVADGLR